jgi:hypothetical protein
VQQLGDEVGVALDKPVKILIYETQKDLLGALPPRGVEWAGGQAFPREGIILLNAAPTADGREYGLRTVPHELSHLIIHAATDNPYGGLPRWLDEGLAMYAEGSLPSSFERALQAAIAEDNLLSLRALSGNFPTDPERSLLGYAESHSVVKYLLGQYGRDRMSKLLAVFRDGSTPDDALRAAYGFDTAGMEREWRASIGAKAPAVPGATTPVDTPVPAASSSPTPADAAATPQPAPTPTMVSTGAPSAGRSCFGSLLSIAGALGGLLLLAGRLRG